MQAGKGRVIASHSIGQADGTGNCREGRHNTTFQDCCTCLQNYDKTLSQLQLTS